MIIHSLLLRCVTFERDAESGPLSHSTLTNQADHTHTALYPCLLWNGGKTSSVVLETRGF